MPSLVDGGDGQAQTGAATLLSMLGSSKGLVSGWGAFAAKSLLVASCASTVFGLSSWMLFMGPLGPCLSFLGGAGAGFIGGLVSRWRTDVQEVSCVVDKFPRLLEHHIRLGDRGHELNGTSFEAWLADLPRNPRKQGICIAAMYSAAPALEAIRAEEEQALVSAYAAKKAEAAAAAADMGE